MLNIIALRAEEGLMIKIFFPQIKYHRMKYRFRYFSRSILFDALSLLLFTKKKIKNLNLQNQYFY